MLLKKNIEVILNEITNEYKTLFGNALKAVYLYGSYARGDFDAESDIDIVGIVDENAMHKDINILNDDLIRFASDLGMRYDILISPSIICYDRFIKYQYDLPYYRNIKSEGVVLSA